MSATTNGGKNGVLSRLKAKLRSRTICQELSFGENATIRKATYRSELLEASKTEFPNIDTMIVFKSADLRS